MRPDSTLEPGSSRLRRKRNNDLGTPKVGIFFYVGGKLLQDAVPVNEEEEYGDTVGHGGHYEFWLQHIPRNATERKFKDRAYDAFPRGRVVYFKALNNFVLCADRCLRPETLSRIARRFGISNPRFMGDHHYQCSKCNPYFMD